jgi:AcrR family transcriptional regulator
MDLRGLEQWVARDALVFMSARASRVPPARRGMWPMTPSQTVLAPEVLTNVPAPPEQRARILRAMIKVAGEHGAQAASVEWVSDAAGVSSATFRQLFADRGECLLAALQRSVGIARQDAIRAYATEFTWVRRIRAGLLAVLELFDANRALARLCLLESQAVGSAGHDYRAAVLAELASLVDEGRTAARIQPPPLTAEGVVGGALSIVQTHLLDPQPASLRELINPLMSFIAFPYLGGGAARAQLTHPPVRAAAARSVRPA